MADRQSSTLQSPSLLTHWANRKHNRQEFNGNLKVTTSLSLPLPSTGNTSSPSSLPSSPSSVINLLSVSSLCLSFLFPFSSYTSSGLLTPGDMLGEGSLSPLQQGCISVLTQCMCTHRNTYFMSTSHRHDGFPSRCPTEIFILILCVVVPIFLQNIFVLFLTMQRIITNTSLGLVKKNM